jgi:hypoxanthine phosphoribosyltransferase
VSQTELESAVGEVLVDTEALGARIAELGAEISADYEGRDLLLIGVLKGADVLVVEDIIDSGLTLSYLMRNLESREPATLEVCALLTKPDRREMEVPVRYIGFEIPNRFVIGYGLDFGERYRNLPYVAVLSDDALPESI